MWKVTLKLGISKKKKNIEAWWSILSLFLFGYGLTLNKAKTELVSININSQNGSSKLVGWVVLYKSSLLPQFPTQRKFPFEFFLG